MDVFVLDEHTIEAVVDHGVEVTPSHIVDMLHLAARITQEPRGLLANRKNEYSFSLSAMTFIAKAEDFRAVAVLTHDRGIPFISRMLKPLNCSLAFFEQREQALVWLRTKLKN